MKQAEIALRDLLKKAMWGKQFYSLPSKESLRLDPYADTVKWEIEDIIKENLIYREDWDIVPSWNTFLRWVIEHVPDSISLWERQRFITNALRFSYSSSMADNGFKYWDTIQAIIKFTPPELALNALMLMTSEIAETVSTASNEHQDECFLTSEHEGEIVHPEQWLAFAMDTSLSAKEREGIPFSVLIHLVKAYDRYDT